MDIETRLTRLEAITETVQRDVGEIKQELRRLDSKIDAVKESVEKVKDSVSALAQKIAASEGVMIKWMVGTALGTASVVIAFVSLLVHVMSR